MPKFRITSPDGKNFDVEGPEGSTADQALAQVQAQYKPQQETSGSPAVSGMASLAATVAGIPIDAVQNIYNLGKAGVGLATGRSQDFPLVEGTPGGSESIRNVLRKASEMSGLTGLSPDNPTPGSQIGTAAYDFASRGGVIPGAALPAAASMVAEKTLGPQYAGIGALAPSAATLAYNTARAPALANAQAQNVTRDATINRSREAGLVMPPAQTNPSVTNKVLEGTVGTPSLEALGSTKNQQIINDLGRRALGVGKNVPINETLLDNLRADAGKAYQAIKDFGGGRIAFKPDAKFQNDIDNLGGGISDTAKRYPTAAKTADVEALKQDLTKGPMAPGDAIELTKKLRRDASANFRASDDPAKLDLARAQRGAADAIEGLVERNLGKAGRGDLVKDFREARITIAKTYDVQAALNDATGNLNARTWANISNKGKPLGPEMQLAADFSNAFPRSSLMPEKGGNRTGIGTWDAILAAAGVGGAVMHPAIAALGVGRPLARYGLLTKPYQNWMGAPSYEPAMMPQNPQQAAIMQSVLANQGPR
jgi:hypothetical protein